MADVTGLYRRFGVKLPYLADGWASTRCFTGHHQDRHPSARVHLQSGGFKCFACGEKGGVLHALELLGVYDRDEARRLAVDYGILDPPRHQRKPSPDPKPIPPPSPAPPPPPPRVESELGDLVNWDTLAAAPEIVHDRNWAYTDQDGTPVGRVRRLDLADGQKRIWQERPDGTGWAIGLNGAHLPLYRLPDVLQHAQKHLRVLIVEGEKAVDALDRLGFFATTNAGGAGKWRDEHTTSLAGATCLVVCDSDKPGRDHAYIVTARLLNAGVDTLAPLDVAPLNQDGFDIVDHLAGVAATARAVNPEITNDAVRASLHQHLQKMLDRQLPADPQALQRWHEHNSYLADPAGHAYLHCQRCDTERVHHVTHGLAYCKCGAQQPAPA